MKTCTKCKHEYEATTENFGPDKRNRSGLQAQCRACDKDRKREYLETSKSKAYQKEYQKEYQRSDKCKAYRKEYYATVNGYLHSLFSSMTGRCARQESYTNKGIRNNFKSPDDLIDYVTNVLRVDPRGRDCHRIDDDGHYERGNIEFLTEQEHIEKHGNKFCGVAGVG